MSFSLNSIIYSFLLLGAGCDDSELSNLKLQKLLYYAQGKYLARTQTPLFEEALFAWPHGPVVKIAYEQLKGFASRSITPDAYLDSLNGITPAALPPEIDQHLQQIYDEYGPYTAWYLRNLTHSETPWIETDHLQEITQDKLRHFFQGV